MPPICRSLEDEEDFAMPVRKTAKTPTVPTASCHFPGCVPAATALRVLLASAGVTNPLTKEPFSEHMLFGIAGPLGIWAASFRYQNADHSSSFITSRHPWFDHLLSL